MIGTRVPARPAEIEPPEAPCARHLERLPVEERVRIEREEFLPARRPGDDEGVLETDGDESAQHGVILPYQGDPCALPETVEDRAEERQPVDGRPHVPPPR